MSTTRREAIAAILAAALGAALAPGIDPDAERWFTHADGTRVWMGPVRADRSRRVIVGWLYEGRRVRAEFPRMMEAKPGTWEYLYEPIHVPDDDSFGLAI